MVCSPDPRIPHTAETIQRQPRQLGTEHGKGVPSAICEEHKGIGGRNRRGQAKPDAKGIIHTMDRVYAYEEK
jgi:hypothetical protein